MRKLYRDTWADALESGEYTQGQNSLRLNEYYCCLGVFCALGSKGHWDREKYIGPTGGRDNGVPPLDALDAAGLSHESTNQFVVLNDEEEFTFKEIAIVVRHCLSRKKKLSVNKLMALGLCEYKAKVVRKYTWV